MTGVDPTLVIERMAGRLRSAGATHPVAAAVALAARGHTRLERDEFAHSAGVVIDVVRTAESGDIPFGDLPPQVGLAVMAAGADLLALADLETTWQSGPPNQAAGS